MGQHRFTFRNSIELLLDDTFSVDRYILEHGTWEPFVACLFPHLIDESSNCLDIGGNNGIHALAMASICRLGTVCVFEPDEENLPNLRTNIALNPELAHRIKVFPLAVSDHRGTLKLFHSGDLQNRGNSYVNDEFIEERWNRSPRDVFQSCEVARLDDLDLPTPVHFIKCDIEGGEAKAFEGGRTLIERDRPIIIFESLFGDFGVEAVYRCEAFLRAREYQLFGYNPGNGKLHAATVPFVLADTLAIPSEKVGRFSEIISPVPLRTVLESLPK